MWRVGKLKDPWSQDFRIWFIPNNLLSTDCVSSEHVDIPQLLKPSNYISVEVKMHDDLVETGLILKLSLNYKIVL